MLASLPMYDLPELRPVTDAWWAGLRRALARSGVRAVPGRLTRSAVCGAEWNDPGLLLSQCCGWDLTHAYAGRVQPVATPVYRAPGCSGPYYRSLFVVRADDPAGRLEDLRGRVCVINMPDSQSGCNTLRYSLARRARGQPFFRQVLVSEGHATSVDWVSNGRADLAAIDCVTFALLRRYRPQATAGLRVLAGSRRAPALPYITRAEHGPALLARLRAGLQTALTDPELREVRATLLIGGFEFLPVTAYEYLRTQERRARALAYPTLS